MFSIVNPVKNRCREAVDFLNNPTVKSEVKKVSGYVSFTFGLIAAYDIYQNFDDISVSSVNVAKFSLVLTAATTPLGVRIISTVVKSLFTREQLESVFGPNTIFEINPRHPRHISSIAAVIMALPLVAQSTLSNHEGIWFTDETARYMALYNTTMSRFVLHLGNAACKWILRY